MIFRGILPLRKLSAVTVLTAGLRLASCATASEAQSPAAELPQSERAQLERSLLDQAVAALAEIESLENWIAASAEYAEALAAADRRDEAVSLLTIAHRASSGLENEKRLKANIAINQALTAIGAFAEADGVASSASTTIKAIESANARQDALAKLATSTAAAGNLEAAIAQLAALPQNESGLASLKARGYREVAEKAASQKDFETAPDHRRHHIWPPLLPGRGKIGRRLARHCGE